MPRALDGGAVDWLPWCRDAFARARAERKPVLLSIVAPWSSGCAEMDRESYADAATAAVIHERVVPVRVDAEERPDLAEHYGLGGLPTTAFLTCDGRLLGGGTFVPPDRLQAAITRVTPTAHLVDAGVAPGEASGPSASPCTVDDVALTRITFADFDEEHGGFGAAPKFPLATPVRLAIDLYAVDGAVEMLERAVRTLDAMGWGPLYDEPAGGFFRCAMEKDWSAPQREKLLITQAVLLDLYLHAGTSLGHERWFARAVDIVQYMNAALAVPGSGWRTSEGADETRQFSDGNALATSALLRAAAVFQDDALGKRTLDAFERVLLSSYKPGQGVAHGARGLRGLLTDQVAMAAASLDAWESTGNVVYRMMAEELMHFALRTIWDDEAGGFFDRAEAPDVEPLPRSVKPFVLNCEAAVVLQRLAQAVTQPLFASRAQEALDAVAGQARAHGPLAAHYLLARRAVLR